MRSAPPTGPHAAVFRSVKAKDAERRSPRIDADALAPVDTLDDDDELIDATISGDLAGAELSLVTLRRSVLQTVTFTAARLVRATFVDCVLADCELSGTTFDDCRFERVEFRRCRMTGVLAHGNRFVDVGIHDSKLDGANLRMSMWERGELRDCSLKDCDLYGAQLPGSRIHGCDLTNVDFSKGDLSGSHLQGSNLEGIRGGDALRGITIGTDQLIPAALAVFDAMGIAVKDEE